MTSGDAGSNYGTGDLLPSVVNSAANDVNAGTGTFTAFALSSAGAVTASGMGVTLTGGPPTISLNTQVVLSLVVNSSAAAVTYTSAGFTNTLPAFASDLYSSILAGGTTYLGRLTTTTGTNTTTNIPQQLGFADYNNTAPSLRINELDVTAGLNIATAVPEPSTYACIFTALAGLAAYARRRTRREA